VRACNSYDENDTNSSKNRLRFDRFTVHVVVISELMMFPCHLLVVENEHARSLDELSEELAQTKEVVERLWRQAASLSQELSLVSADVKATLRLLLNPSTNDAEQFQTPALRLTRRDRAARFCRGFSEASAADNYYSPKSSRRISDGSSLPSITANYHTASASKPLTRRVDNIQDSESQQRSVDKDNTQLTPAVKNHNVNTNISKSSVKHWQTDVDNWTKSTSPNAAADSASTTVRLGRSLLRSSTSPEFIQHHMTSLVGADGQRPQTLLTTSTMKRVEKFRRRAAAASTALVTDRDSFVTSTDL